MTSADGSCIKEGISVVRKEYSVLKEDMKLHECGWSQRAFVVALANAPRMPW
jgi:hypothetical protein